MWHVASRAAAAAATSFWILSQTLSFKIKDIHTSLASCKEPLFLSGFYET
jgi:hypothetical protein